MNMTREIMKFRAWDEYNKNFSYWTMNDLCNWQDDNPDKPSALEEWTQFTGLHDKNGKEIYEGDIVEWDDNSNGKWRRRCEVIYTPAHYRLVGYYYDVGKPEIHHPIEFNCGAFIYEEDGELEVIGNIYQNKNLIN